ncbi:6-phosphogluconolactonase, partial [Candidatus Peregrinibacteria bacterium]|nr:6-phosphogluconolactonase [Candidatus Peregrinibacteria bacterium]
MKDYPVIVSGDEDAFVQSAKDFLEREIVSAIQKNGRAVIGLSGGSTPRPIYEALGKSRLIDWSKVWIFLVDDRYIRPDDPKSNQFLLRSTLLKNAAIPESQIIFPDVSLPLPECI